MLPVLGGVVWSKESDKRFQKCPSCHVKGWINHPTCRTLLHENRDSKLLSVQQVQIQLVQQRELWQLLLKKSWTVGKRAWKQCEHAKFSNQLLHILIYESKNLQFWRSDWLQRMFFCAIRLFSRTNNSEQTTYKCKKKGKPCLNVHR